MIRFREYWNHTCDMDVLRSVPIRWSPQKCCRVSLPSVIPFNFSSDRSRHEKSVGFSFLPWGRLRFLFGGSLEDDKQKS